MMQSRHQLAPKSRSTSLSSARAWSSAVSMSLWASVRLSYGPWACAGVFAPSVSVMRVASATVFIRDSLMRYVGQPQRSRNHGETAASDVPPQQISTPIGASRVFDIREHFPGQLGAAAVHLHLHGACRDVEAPREAPDPDQIL